MGGVCKSNRAHASVHGAGNDTWEYIWKYFVLAFNSLFLGFHPEKDPFDREWPVGSHQRAIAGHPIGGGYYFGVIWVLTWDQEFGSNELKCPHFNSLRPCLWCPANRSSLNFRDVSVHARWKQLQYQPGPSDRPVSDHPIWLIAGVTRFHSSGDEMHGIALGPLQELHGSVIADLIDNELGRFVGGSNGTRVDEVWRELRSCMDRVGVSKRLTNLTVTMIGKPTRFPCLASKAAEARSLVKPMLLLVREHPKINSMHWQHVERCYKHIDDFYDVIENAGICLTTGQADIVKFSLERFTLHFSTLTQLSAERGVPRYNFTTKLHTAYHIGAFAQYLSPRCSWTYAFEDFMKTLIAIGKACSPGTPTKLIPMKIMEHYMLILSINLHGRLYPR